MFNAMHLHALMRGVMSFYLPVSAVCCMVSRLPVRAVILRLFMPAVILMALCSSFVFRGRGIVVVPVMGLRWFALL
jgi:hypothetical protein